MTRKLLLVPLAIGVNITLLYVIALLAPEGGSGLRFPGTLDDIRQLASLLTTYNTHHPGYVLLLFR